MPGSKILIIEDDTALAGGLRKALSTEQNETLSCSSLRKAERLLEKEQPNLLILDVNLPDGDGYDFLKKIRRDSSVPVIMLTANDIEADIVAALEAGADDYVTKPFSLAVLRARVNAQLRKSRQTAETKVTVIDDYRFDFDRMEYSHSGIPVELSKTEQRLLRVLVENRGLTLSRARLLERVWTDGTEYVDENTLSVAVKRLRDKLNAQDYIKTVYGIGYAWRK